jgi:hypothetical protein
LAWRQIDDEVILVPIRRRADEMDSVYTLNEVAAHIWQLIDGERTVEEICAVVVADFDVDRAQAEADLQELLAELEAIGAVVISP